MSSVILITFKSDYEIPLNTQPRLNYLLLFIGHIKAIPLVLSPLWTTEVKNPNTHTSALLGVCVCLLHYLLKGQLQLSAAVL